MKDPAVLFYTSDFLTGTSLFNFEQKGQYITLLCQQHQLGGLPENHMINVCGSLDSIVVTKFVKNGDGLYYNERMKLEAEKRRNYCKSRSNNKSGRPKIKKNDKIICKSYDKSYVNHMEDENEDRDRDINTTKDLINKYTEDFENFWEVYPKKIGKGEAFKAWRKIKPSQVLQQKIIESVYNQSKSEQWIKDKGQFVPNPSTWLNQERWDDEVKTKSISTGKYDHLVEIAK